MTRDDWKEPDPDGVCVVLDGELESGAETEVPDHSRPAEGGTQ